MLASLPRHLPSATGGVPTRTSRRLPLRPQALAGRIDASKLEGSIRYNGASQQDLKKAGVNIKLLTSYVDQLDVHVRVAHLFFLLLQMRIATRSAAPALPRLS